MSLIKIEKIIKTSTFFSELSTPQILSLAEIAIKKNIGKGEYLFHEGSEGLGLFLLAEGSIQVIKSTESGKETVIKILQPGEVFGEVVMFEQKQYPATAVALSRSVILLFPRHQIDCLFAEREFRNSFIAMIFKKLRYLTDRVLVLAAHDVEKRFFLFLEAQYGKRHEYVVTMSKKDIAAAIATNPETLSRLINKLEKEHKISWKQKKIRILQ